MRFFGFVAFCVFFCVLRFAFFFNWLRFAFCVFVGGLRFAFCVFAFVSSSEDELWFQIFFYSRFIENCFCDDFGDFLETIGKIAR